MQWTLAKDGAQQAILNFVRETKKKRWKDHSLSKTVATPESLIMTLSSQDSSWSKTCGPPTLASLVLKLQAWASILAEKCYFQNNSLSTEPWRSLSLLQCCWRWKSKPTAHWWYILGKDERNSEQWMDGRQQSSTGNKNPSTTRQIQSRN